jgi:hypothetical protein
MAFVCSREQKHGVLVLREQIAVAVLLTVKFVA